ncbi:MAG: metal-dependent hydrolase [Deltaproteobacteria bacterium]|nr:MAG: metal-dependent hydrolase [Deltaproteobacteria bacterium]
MPFMIIDCHLHTGVQNVNWRWEDIRILLRAAGITGAGAIPPVEDVYDRYNPAFTDSPAWRECRGRAHRYLLDLKDPEIRIFPYFFVWNDFAWEDLGPEYIVIKWHRHPDEPEYDYSSPRCREFLEKVRERGLPILLEESLENTLFFLDKLAPDLPVVIPHLGALSGGYRALDAAGVWGREQIWADMAVAGLPEIKDYLNRYGSSRLMFGSDYPFSRPAAELAKIMGLGLPEGEVRDILGGNFRRLCRLK